LELYDRLRLRQHPLGFHRPSAATTVISRSKKWSPSVAATVNFMAIRDGEETR